MITYSNKLKSTTVSGALKNRSSLQTTNRSFATKLKSVVIAVGLFSCALTSSISSATETDMSASNSDQLISQATASITQDSSDTAKAQLLQLLKKIDFFSAAFNQQVFDAQGSLLQQGSGQLAVNKPNLVNWFTQTPDELSIIADGDTIWFYDPFIEQATAYTFETALSNTPVLLLTSNDESIWSNYTVTKIKHSAVETDKVLNEAVVSYSIKSNDDNSQIKRLELSFTHMALNPKNALGSEQNQPQALPTLGLYQLTFEDATGQLSIIELSDVDYTNAPQASSFVFTLPEGVSLDDQR